MHYFTHILRSLNISCLRVGHPEKQPLQLSKNQSSYKLEVLNCRTHCKALPENFWLRCWKCNQVCYPGKSCLEICERDEAKNPSESPQYFTNAGKSSLNFCWRKDKDFPCGLFIVRVNVAIVQTLKLPNDWMDRSSTLYHWAPSFCSWHRRSIYTEMRFVTEIWLYFKLEER